MSIIGAGEIKLFVCTEGTEGTDTKDGRKVHRGREGGQLCTPPEAAGDCRRRAI